jgi:NAD(P)-dependent dehydrogenase (short-subunit alcohol dehydrogenase family)
MRRLTGRVAVVTGAASGIGRAMAARFAAEGMRCVLADVETEPLDRAVAELRRSGAAAIGVRTDVASAADVRALADRAVAEFGAVHVLCNNAGVGSGSDFSTIPLEVWEWVLGVTLWGVIHGCRTFLPILLEQDEAHIVNTSSAEQLHADFHGRHRRGMGERARAGDCRGCRRCRNPRPAVLYPDSPGRVIRHG